MNLEDIKETTIVEGDLKYGGNQYVDPNFIYAYDGRIYKIKKFNDKNIVFVEKLKDYSLADVLSIYTSLPYYMKSLFRRVIGVYFSDMIGVSPHGGLISKLDLENIDPKTDLSVFDVLYDSLFQKIKSNLYNLFEKLLSGYDDESLVNSFVNDFYDKFKASLKKSSFDLYNFLYKFFKDYGMDIDINTFDKLKKKIEKEFSILLGKYSESLNFKFEKKYLNVITKYNTKKFNNFWQIGFINDSFSVEAIFPFYNIKNIDENSFLEILFYFSTGIPYEIYSKFFILKKDSYTSKYSTTEAPFVRQKLHENFRMKYISKPINAKVRKVAIKDIKEEREREARHFFNLIVYFFENYKFNLSDVINEFSRVANSLKKITKRYLSEFSNPPDDNYKEFAKERFYEILRGNFWDIFNSEFVGDMGEDPLKNSWYSNMQKFLKFFNDFDEFENDDIDYVKKIFNLNGKFISDKEAKKCASKFLLDYWYKFKFVFKYFKIDSSTSEEEIMKKYGIKFEFARRIRFERYLWEKFGNLGLLVDVNFNSFDSFEDFKNYVNLVLEYKLK